MSGPEQDLPLDDIGNVDVAVALPGRSGSNEMRDPF